MIDKSTEAICQAVHAFFGGSVARSSEGAPCSVWDKGYEFSVTKPEVHRVLENLYNPPGIGQQQINLEWAAQSGRSGCNRSCLRLCCA